MEQEIYERMPYANTGLGEVGQGSQFPASSHGRIVPDIVEATRAFLQARSQEHASPMDQRFEMPSGPQTHLRWLVQQSRSGGVALLGRVTLLP